MPGRPCSVGIEEADMRRGILRLVVALALVAVLLGPVAPAQAAGSYRSGGILWSWASLWSWITAAVSPLPALQADCGSHMDPNGGCVTTISPTPRGK
jgi:hypothetical protein